MKRRLSLMFSAAAAVAVAALPGTAQACAVCFGKTDSPLGKGLHWGVFALLLFIFAMLAAFGAFAVFLARRCAAMEREQLAEEAALSEKKLDS